MLAFGHEQALALEQLTEVPATARQLVAESCAVFSALLSVFDYVVDEAGQAAVVFGVEQDAVAGLFRADGAEARLAETYQRVADVRVRLLLAMFAILGRQLRELYGRFQNAQAWAALQKEMRRLFTAERTSTLGRWQTLAQLRRLSDSSRAKSVLPFVTLLRVVALAGLEPGPSVAALRATTALGRAVSQADDLVDLLTDLRRGAPSPLTSRLAERSAAGAARAAGARDLRGRPGS
jgi:hypothetical protein